MRVIWRNSLLLFLACAGAIAQAQTGRIRGTLLDDNGNPVANAEVFVTVYLHCDLSNEATRAKLESGAPNKCLSVADGRTDATTDPAQNGSLIKRGFIASSYPRNP